ncbi:MAG: hypothetical protein ACR2PG_23345 [Hyphomicrobiaceae bacterium]
MDDRDDDQRPDGAADLVDGLYRAAPAEQGGSGDQGGFQHLVVLVCCLDVRGGLVAPRPLDDWDGGSQPAVSFYCQGDGPASSWGGLVVCDGSLV